MNEAGSLEEAVSLLEDKYSEEHVVVEPNLKSEQAVYPDIAVFRDSEHTKPFLLVEWSSLRTSHRAEQDLSEISEAVAGTGAPYGALLSPRVQFIFSGTGPEYHSYAHFPEIDEEDPSERRQVQSRAELDFLIDRCLDAQAEVRPSHVRNGQAADELLESLHLLLELRNTNGIGPKEIEQSTISSLYTQIDDRYQWYQRGEELDHQFLIAAAGIFQGFSLDETEDKILESLFEISDDDRRGGEYATPLEVAKQMVRLAGPKSGDLVLDPAAGRGTILSQAAGEGANGVGVEINPAVLRIATFYVDLFKRDVEFTVGDFFEMKEDLMSYGEFDQVIVDPPFGMRLDTEEVPYTDERKNLQSEEAFIAQGLSLLKKGGRLTISVPSGFLHNARKGWFRKKILEEFQLDSVIQIVNGPIYRYTSIDTAFVTITKQSPASDHKVQYAVLESPEDPQNALSKAVSEVEAESADSILQANLEDSWNIRLVTNQRSIQTALEEQFSQIVDLHDVAEVSTGNPPNNLVEEEDKNTLTYLSISDIGKRKSRHGDRYIPRDEARIIADDSCVLLATLGEHTYTHIPSEPLAPAQDLAVLRFESPEEALVYETFLSSELGKEQVDALKSGSRIPRVNIGDLRELKVPLFSEEERRERAEAIREHQEKVRELEAKQTQLQEERKSLVEDPSEFLTGGDDDE
jgi:type I restriction-modification system DNA methylase subunit